VAEKVCWRAGWSKAAKPELVYLAGVYHDIGKVVVAIHSELGAVDEAKLRAPPATQLGS
jgi:UTP:GlnB (protein PII) uridylyltransferase